MCCVGGQVKQLVDYQLEVDKGKLTAVANLKSSKRQLFKFATAVNLPLSTSKIQTLLDSLTELSKLLGLPAQSRSPKLMLRLHNQAFIHAMICKEIIGQPKALTSRKFYGRYWHSLTAHAGKHSRIISAKSTNTEEEERHFNRLQGVTRLTSRRPCDIITPNLIRLQAEQKLAESKQGNAVKVQESQISKYYSTLPPLPNTIVPNRYIVKNPKEYQAHLQTISDFIACGEGVWWRQILSEVEIF